MSKAVKVSHHTLEQERNVLKARCVALRLEAICYAIGFFLFLVVGAIHYAKTGAPRFCVGLSYLALPFDGAVIIVVVNFVTGLCKEIEGGDIPFRYSVVDKMEGLANAVIAGGLVIGIPQVVIQAIEAYTTGSFSMTGSLYLLGGAFLGCALLVIASAFAIGCKLRQEAEEIQ